MMKNHKIVSRLTAFLLLTAMVFLLAACGNMGNVQSSDVPESEMSATDAPENETEEAYRQGKVRALGISNFDNWPEAFYDIVDDMEIKPAVLQIECHPFAQRLETRALAEEYGIQIECWYPLGHADQRLLNNDVLSEIAEAHGKSVVQVILRRHMQEGFSVR